MYVLHQVLGLEPGLFVHLVPCHFLPCCSDAMALKNLVPVSERSVAGHGLCVPSLGYDQPPTQEHTEGRVEGSGG